MEVSPPVSVAQRLSVLEPAALPVLRATHAAIAHWAARADEVDASRLADIALRDPLMCLRMLQHVAATLGRRLQTPVQTVTAALVLTGIEPFFRAFRDLPVLEDRFAAHPAGLHGVLAAVTRAHAAARISVAFAVHRQDDDVELLHQAALLHDFPELLLWCVAPDAALELARLRRQEPQMADGEAERQVLGGELAAVGQALLQRWELPASLCEAARALDMHGPAALNVRLAVQIAHHLQDGWQHPALAEDLRQAGLLLNLPPDGVASLVRHAL